MPLGNYTSQFFANIYLNELDYFVKHNLKVNYYIRYVDDFVILHRSKKRLQYYLKVINKFLKLIKLEIHPEKSNILPLRNGITFIGYRIFYHYKLLRKRNIKHFERKFKQKLELCKEGILNKKDLLDGLNGWFGYSKWANTYNLRQRIINNLSN